MNSHGVVDHDAKREPRKPNSFGITVHGRLGNTKIAKNYFLMSEWGMPYTVGKLS